MHDKENERKKSSEETSRVKVRSLHVDYVVFLPELEGFECSEVRMRIMNAGDEKNKIRWWPEKCN